MSGDLNARGTVLPPKVIPWWLALVSLVAGVVQLAAWETELWIRLAVLGALVLVLYAHRLAAFVGVVESLRP